MNENHIVRIVVLLILAGAVIVVSLLAAGKFESSDRKHGDFQVIIEPGFTTTPPPTTTPAPTTTSTSKPVFDDTLTKYLFSDAIVNQFGGRCLDGTSAGYYLSKAPETSNSTKKWIIFLEGGSYCKGPYFPNPAVPNNSTDSCLYRATTIRGSSAQWVDKRTPQYPTNMIQRDYTVNKYFYDWNFVWVPYCSGDLWAGERIVNSTASYGLYFAGKAIITSVLESLRADLSVATDIILAGDSAGGIGTVYNADRVGEWVNKATAGKAFFAGQPQAAWFGTSLNYKQFAAQLPSYSNAAYRPPRLSQVALPGFDTAIQFRFHEECANKTRAEYAHYCFIPPYLYRFVRTPLFFAQNILDQFEIFLLNGAPTSIDVGLTSYLHFFAANARASYKSQIVDRNYEATYSVNDNYVDGYSANQLLIDNPQLKYNGIYAALCLKHEVEFTNANPTDAFKTNYPNVQNKQVHEVFYWWYQTIRELRMNYDIRTQNVPVINQTFYYIDQSPINLLSLCVGKN